MHAGVDLIVAQGTEAGGHTGEIGTMVLVPEVVDAVAPVPVLAAGGIGRGRQMAAAMALGAQGVWCGSVWLTTEEAETHPVVKEKFLARDVGRHDALALAHRQAGAAAAARRGPTSGSDADTPDPLGDAAAADARRRGAAAHPARPPHTKGSGAEQLANYFVGQVVGTMNQAKPARQVVLDMVEEFIEATERSAASSRHERRERWCAPVQLTENRCHSSGRPLSRWPPRSTNDRPEPATRS